MRLPSLLTSNAAVSLAAHRASSRDDRVPDLSKDRTPPYRDLRVAAHGLRSDSHTRP